MMMMKKLDDDEHTHTHTFCAFVLHLCTIHEWIIQVEIKVKLFLYLKAKKEKNPENNTIIILIFGCRIFGLLRYTLLSSSVMKSKWISGLLLFFRWCKKHKNQTMTCLNFHFIFGFGFDSFHFIHYAEAMLINHN